MSTGEFGRLDPRVRYSTRGAAMQNFGDYLPELFGRELLRGPAIFADTFRLVGSVIETEWLLRDLRRANGFHTGVVAYWGCGMREDRPLSAQARQHAVFFAVRGELTRRTLDLPADTPLGDTGLLVPLCHVPAPRAAPDAGPTICIPHFEDRRPGQQLLALSGCEQLVQPLVPAKETALRAMLDSIAGASFVLSASLHGAIVAFAYRRPFAFWNNGHLDVPFKWADFSSSIGIDARFSADLKAGQQWYREVSSRLTRPKLLPLLLSCPFTPRIESVLKAAIADECIEADASVAAALRRLSPLLSAADARLATLSADCERRSGPLKPTPGRAALRAIGLAKESAKRNLRRTLGI